MQIQPADMLSNIALSDTIKPAVVDGDVCDHRVLDAAQVPSVLALSTRDVAQLDVARDRLERTFGTFLIREVDRQYGIRDLTDLHVAHEDVLQNAAPHSVVLEPQRAI